MQSVSFGKARISIESKGCVSCGTEWSSGWAAAQVVPVQIGNRRIEVTVSICAECQAEKTPLLQETEP